MVCFLGGSRRLPESQRSGQATVSEQSCRSLDFKRAGGLLWLLNVPSVTLHEDVLVPLDVLFTAVCAKLHLAAVHSKFSFLYNVALFSLCRCPYRPAPPRSCQFELVVG